MERTDLSKNFKGTIGTLIKTSIKEGKKSKVPPGKKRVVEIAEEPIPGKPFNIRNGRGKSVIPASTNILTVKPEDKILVFETITSWYQFEKKAS